MDKTKEKPALMVAEEFQIKVAQAAQETAGKIPAALMLPAIEGLAAELNALKARQLDEAIKEYEKEEKEDGEQNENIQR